MWRMQSNTSMLNFRKAPTKGLFYLQVILSNGLVNPGSLTIFNSSELFLMLSGIRPLLAAKIFILWFAQTDCYAQQIEADTTFLTQSKKKSIALYTASILQQSRLYNGSDYIIYLPKDEEHPYFEMDDWTYGSVVYWNEQYENIPLMYDIQFDQLITEHNRGNPIKLLPEKVQSFSLLDRTFVRLTGDEKNNISVGFYDRLYDGRSKVYAKYAKAFRETIEAREVIPHFDEHTRYYLVKDSIFYTVKTKRSLLNVFDDQRQDVKGFIRKNRIRFKDNKPAAIVRIAQFYDSLKY